LFLKRFHKHPSIDSAVFCAHKIVATSPCRWNNRALPRSRDMACLRFRSSKLRRGVLPKVAQSPDRSLLALHPFPFAGGAAARISKRVSMPEVILLIEDC